MQVLKIRGKMGLLILALIAVMGAAVIKSVGMLSAVEQELSELDQSTSAAFAANALIAVSDEEMSLSISQSLQASELSDLREIHAEFRQVLEQTKTQLRNLSQYDEGERRLMSQLELLGQRMERLIDARRSVLELKAERDEVLARVQELTERLDATFAILLVRTFDDVGAGQTDRSAENAAFTRLQSQYVALRTRLSDLSSVGRTAEMSATAEAYAGVGSLVRAISMLGNAAPVSASAQALSELSNYLSPEGFLPDVADRLAQGRRAVEIARSDVNEARRATDRLTADIADSIAKNVVNERRRVFEAETRFLRQQAIIISVVVLTILLLVWLVTDRWIVRRIEHLTAETKRVANGDLDRKIKVDGDDEIGEMADALAVFRANAIELRRSNQELGDFAYAASHDLRSPLRAIRNLVDWTIEDSGDQLPEDTMANLEMIRARADRLSRLLSDLLDYARAGGGDVVEIVHLPGLVRDIAEIADPDRCFSVTFEGDRCVTSAGTPLRTILLNLVSNAIKHHDREDGSVTIRHELTADQSILVVEDDGPGIPTQYREKVFDIFQTLRPADEVEGSGMGLAIVRKLAGELGGSIRLDEQDEGTRGARFIIAIPLSDKVVPEMPQIEAGDEGRAA